jgi:DHA1 family multidrug resistance protein-like MFS transporter
MNALLREAAIGQIIRYVTKNKFFKYPEEEEGFVVPEVYANPDTLLNPKTIQEESSTASITETPSEGVTPFTERRESEAVLESNVDLEKAETQLEPIHAGPGSNYAHMTRTKTREETLPYSHERFEVDRIATLDRAKSTPIMPQVTNRGDILVDWYTTDDLSNPQNWTLNKKNFSTFILW